MKPLIAAFLSVLTLTACGGAGEAIERYGSVKPITFTAAGQSWRLHDRPDENLLMLSPTPGSAMAAGARRGATLGIAHGGLPEDAVFLSAAQAYLAPRNCTVTSQRVILFPQREFAYSC